MNANKVSGRNSLAELVLSSVLKFFFYDFFKAFEKECSDLRKGLQAKEQQLQTYRSVSIQIFASQI